MVYSLLQHSTYFLKGQHKGNTLHPQFSLSLQINFPVLKSRMMFISYIFLLQELITASASKYSHTSQMQKVWFRLPQKSEYCNKASHTKFFLVSHYVYTILKSIKCARALCLKNNVHTLSTEQHRELYSVSYDNF